MNDDVMKKQLDAMLSGAEPSAQPEAVPVQEEPPFDPLTHLIGNTDPDADKDPFTMMLDGMLAGEGLNKETETPEYKTASFEEHEWELKEELVYEDDVINAICKKCFRQMRMNRQQTWNGAQMAHGINSDCGQGVAADVMDS
mgnify:CR=1 FL=1